MSVESKYFFNGGKFIDYIDQKMFKLTIKEKMCLKFEESDTKEDSFGDFYTKVINVKPKKEVDKILFDHVFYGQLKHIFVHKLSINKGIDLKLFNKNITELIKKYKSIAINDAILRNMKPEGFFCWIL